MTDWNDNNENNDNNGSGKGSENNRDAENNGNVDEQARREGEANGMNENNMGETDKMGGSESSGGGETYGIYESYESFETFDADETPTTIVSEREFDRIVAEGVSMIDFYAKWCGPCRMTGATFDSLARRFAGRATIAKVDVDAHPNLGTRCDISAVPTVLLYEDGELRERFVGVRSEAELADALEVTLAGVGV